MGTKLVKISDQLYEKVKEMSNKSGITIREFVEKAISLYMQGYSTGIIDKEIKNVMNKVIVVQFDGVCAKCKKPIKKGSPAYYIRITYTDNTYRSFLYHLSCYMSEFELALADQIIEREKIKTEINALKKKRKKLVEEIANKLMYIQKMIDKIAIDVEQIRGFDEYYDIAYQLEHINTNLAKLRAEFTALFEEDLKEKIEEKKGLYIKR